MREVERADIDAVVGVCEKDGLWCNYHRHSFRRADDRCDEWWDIMDTVEAVIERLEYHLLEHSGEQLENVHHPSQCEGRPCPIHNMTDHPMRSFPQHWRGDRGIIERICPHGVGIPDPDNPPWINWVHGCCPHCCPTAHGHEEVVVME